MNNVKKNEEPVLEHKISEIELEKYQLPNGYYIKIIKDQDGLKVDIRRHYKGYPTKHGITLQYELIKSIFNAILNKYK